MYKSLSFCVGLQLLFSSFYAYAVDRAELLQQWRITCSPQNLRASPWLGPQCDQWRAQIKAMKEDGDADDSGNTSSTSTGVIGQTVIQPPLSAKAQQRTVENMNRCISVTTRPRRNSSELNHWVFNNNCPVPISLAYCTQANCKLPTSEVEIKAGGSDYTYAVEGSPGPKYLSCPTDSNNTTDNGIWACWVRR